MSDRKNDPSMLSEGGNFDMTPMIDMTFLLIIFFMVVTEIADVAKSELDLPVAEKSVPDDNAKPGRLVINITANDFSEIMGRQRSWREIAGIVGERAVLDFDKEKALSNLSVLIRADCETQYESISRVMRICMDNRVYKIAYATDEIK